jgi:hypothetical protein
MELRNNALARYLEAADEAVDATSVPQGQGDQLLMASAAVADAAAASIGSSSSGSSGLQRQGSVFASMSMGMATSGGAWGGVSAPHRAAVGLGRASRAMLASLSAAGKQVPLARPRLARPARQQHSAKQQQQQQ